MGLVKDVRDGVGKVKRWIHLAFTPIGQVIGALLLVIFVIVFVYVLGKVVGHTIGLFFDDDYAGISTSEDYETIIGSMGYSGYDAYISEEKWQEFSAFEYEVLMDVAEYMYDNQSYVTKIESGDIKYITSVVFPEGIVETEYDAGSITKKEWKEYMINGQDGNAPGSLNKKSDYVVGGNRNVITPRLVYETTDHEYESNAYSLMPYLVVVREDMELSYFLTGLDETKYANYKNLDVINSEDLKTNISPVRFSAELNRFNTNMPVSAYKKDLAKAANNKTIKGVDDAESFVKADRDSGYGDDIYYTEQTTEIVYKIPLKLLVNRYLPKATLLATWYMLKPDNPNGQGVDVNEMMDSIKQIYRSACLGENTNEVAPTITTAGRKNDATGDILTGVINVNLRQGPEDIVSKQVEAVKYSGDGSVVRDENGKAIKEQKTINYASSNKKTFIYFEQYGLETSTYEKYVAYKSGAGATQSKSDEANPEAVSPSATYLTRDRVNFIKSLNLTLKNITYENASGDKITLDEFDVRLKPSYVLDSGLDDGMTGEKIDEKLKSRYIYGSGIVSINQDAPYAFMKKVRESFESRQINQDVTVSLKEDEYIYKNKFMSKQYILAKVGKVLTQEEQDNVRYLDFDTNQLKFKLPEDYRYYNQDNEMPTWFDFKGGKNLPYSSQSLVEENYLNAFIREYGKSENENDIKAMLLSELEKQGIIAEKIISFDKSAEYTYNESAVLYKSDDKHVTGDDAVKAKDGDVKVNYYWEGVYVIEEKKLEIRQNIHHRRMPAVLVKYAETWAKSVVYSNTITQNSIDYRNYKYLIPFSKTSLGLQSMNLVEKPKYRVSTFEKYYNKINEENKGLKEADILDMLIQWEDYANKGNEVAYAYMRDLYKLTIFVRDSESSKNNMLKTAYSYLYIPSTISNYDEGTLQKIFWLERIGVTKGEDELSEKEQNIVRYKANEVRWQNLEYDEYYECIEKSGDKERVKVYALFPFGAPVVRSYYMLNNINNLAGQGFKDAAHPGIDISSRKFIKEILNHEGTSGEHIYYYELNRLTISYLRNGNNKEDAFYLAQKELNNTLKQYSLYSPIVAIAPGYVSEVGYNSRSGFYVKIVHDYKEKNPNSGYITSFYAHFKRWPLVAEGDFIGAGTVLGYEGNTGRSTGAHLHLEICVKNAAGTNIGGKNNKVNPVELITPVFSPFYYAEKAKAIVDENKDYALGSEYYKLERTILLDDGLYNHNNVINGMKLDDGTVVSYTPTTNQTEPYNSGDAYIGGAYSGLIWGNNVPTKPLVDDISKIMDLNLLNRTVSYKVKNGENGSGEKLEYDEGDKKFDSNPDFFNIESELVKQRLRFKDLTILMKMSEYKSSLVVPYYNGPRSNMDKITQEGAKDFENMQISLKKAGYYKKAGVNGELAGEDIFYSEDFIKVVKAMQQDLIDKGYGTYGVSVTGNLDAVTVSAYNTMVQYTPGSEEASYQTEMSKRIAYNASTDLSIESALIWSLIKQEMGYDGGPDDEKFLALKETETSTGGATLEYSKYNSTEDKYDTYVKNFNKKQGLMQIEPAIAIRKYAKDGVKAEDAVLRMRMPKQNTKIGTELFKEYVTEIYKKYSRDIEKAKNDVVFNGGGSEYWKNIYEECSYYANRWVSPENIDRLMLYAIALEAYDNKDVNSITSARVNEIVTGNPSNYAMAVLETFREYILVGENKSTKPTERPSTNGNSGSVSYASFTDAVKNNIDKVMNVAKKYSIESDYLLGILAREGGTSQYGTLYFGLTWPMSMALTNKPEFIRMWQNTFGEDSITVADGRKINKDAVVSNPQRYFADFNFCLELSAALTKNQLRSTNNNYVEASKQYCLGNDSYIISQVNKGVWTNYDDAIDFTDACYSYARMMGRLVLKYKSKESELKTMIALAPGVGNYYAYIKGGEGPYTLFNRTQIPYGASAKAGTENFMEKYGKQVGN